MDAISVKIGEKFRFVFSDPMGSGNGKGAVYVHTITDRVIDTKLKTITFETDRGSHFTYLWNERPCGLV
jgi:hypothetical protein